MTPSFLSIGGSVLFLVFEQSGSFCLGEREQDGDLFYVLGVNSSTLWFTCSNGNWKLCYIL